MRDNLLTGICRPQPISLQFQAGEMTIEWGDEHHCGCRPHFPSFIATRIVYIEPGTHETRQDNHWGASGRYASRIRAQVINQPEIAGVMENHIGKTIARWCINTQPGQLTREEITIDERGRSQGVIGIIGIHVKPGQAAHVNLHVRATSRRKVNAPVALVRS